MRPAVKKDQTAIERTVTGVCGENEEPLATIVTFWLEPNSVGGFLRKPLDFSFQRRTISGTFLRLLYVNTFMSVVSDYLVRFLDCMCLVTYDLVMLSYDEDSCQVIL